MTAELTIPAFIAGLLTFLAPCTLPLVPGYLGFISGVSAEDVRNPERAGVAKRRIFWNGWWYVVGFSVVFMCLGLVAGLGGQLLTQHRFLLGRIGGVFVIFFGFYMLGVVKLPLWGQTSGSQWLWLRKLKPGNAVSSFLFGATFALGWTPCVGPILGSILVLAATSATGGQGAWLLLVFSLGLGLPFLVIAAAFGSLAPRLARMQAMLRGTAMVGGLFLIFMGFLLLTNHLGVWASWFFQLTGVGRYDSFLLDYL